SYTGYAPARAFGGGASVISNSEMIRIRRQMQRRIRDVVAERRRARQMEAPVADLTGDPTDTRPESSLTPTA
ncbi:hypothetical protein QLR68_19245, partial [Micromonospora sp. DH15]|nr:hypothetical protein [Micromonospora sp. DH15]